MEISKQKELLGTIIEIKLPKEHSSLFFDCFNELDSIEKTYSRFLGSSDLSKVNASLGDWQTVSDEFIYLISKAEEIKEKTNGNFDIALKTHLEELGYDNEYSFKAKKTSEKRKAHIIGEKPSIELNKEENRILLRKEIEFGGLGKGFALDKIKELLDSNKVDRFYINAGGDIFAKSNKEPWPILLEHPDDPQKVIGKIELNDNAIAGSAPNRRTWGNGKFHHLLNAKTKMPAVGVKGIFVIAKTGIEADAYATALFTAGFEEGIDLSTGLPIEMMIISSNNKVYKSKNFEIEYFE